MIITKLRRYAFLTGVIGIVLGLTGVVVHQWTESSVYLLLVLMGVGWFGVSFGVIYSILAIQKNQESDKHEEI